MALNIFEPRQDLIREEIGVTLPDLTFSVFSSQVQADDPQGHGRQPPNRHGRSWTKPHHPGKLKTNWA